MSHLSCLGLIIFLISEVSSVGNSSSNEATHIPVNCKPLSVSEPCIRAITDAQYCLGNGTIVSSFCIALKAFCLDKVAIEADFNACAFKNKEISLTSTEAPQKFDEGLFHSTRSPNRFQGESFSSMGPLSSSESPFTTSETPFGSGEGSFTSSRSPFTSSEIPFRFGRGSFSSTGSPNWFRGRLLGSNESPFSSTETPLSSSSRSINSGSRPLNSGSGSFNSGSEPFSSTETPFSSTETPFSSTETPFSSTETPFSSGSGSQRSGSEHLNSDSEHLNSDSQSFRSGGALSSTKISDGTEETSPTTDESLVSTSKFPFNITTASDGNFLRSGVTSFNGKTSPNGEKALSSNQANDNTKEKNTASDIHKAMQHIIMTSLSFALAYASHLFITP